MMGGRDFFKLIESCWSLLKSIADFFYVKRVEERVETKSIHTQTIGTDRIEQPRVRGAFLLSYLTMSFAVRKGTLKVFFLACRALREEVPVKSSPRASRDGAR